MYKMALATKVNLARRLPWIQLQCEFCEGMEEDNSHALFDCPRAVAF